MEPWYVFESTCLLRGFPIFGKFLEASAESGQNLVPYKKREKRRRTLHVLVFCGKKIRPADIVTTLACCFCCVLAFAYIFLHSFLHVGEQSGNLPVVVYFITVLLLAKGTTIAGRSLHHHFISSCKLVA